MGYSLGKKMAVVGALFVFVSVILSCGQLSLVDHTIVPLPAFAECGDASSAASSPVSREFLGPVGGLLLLLAVVSLLATRPLFEGMVGEPPGLHKFATVVAIRMTPSIINDLQDAFRRGIIHPRLYEST
ncbi:hypothetical protein CL652_03125 [bacterium]|nr:hypothetical protein [bacterium]|tara:strand:- start:55853 stop:56239 length:387 start_codon:yes stop_codon:yes gene_type:complete